MNMPAFGASALRVTDGIPQNIGQLLMQIREPGRFMYYALTLITLCLR